MEIEEIKSAPGKKRAYTVIGIDLTTYEGITEGVRATDPQKAIDRFLKKHNRAGVNAVDVIEGTHMSLNPTPYVQGHDMER